MSGAPLSGLHAIARRHFWAHVETLRGAGLAPDPALAVHDAEGTTAWCDTRTGHVHLAVVDGAAPTGELQIAYLQSLFGLDALDDLELFVRAFLPWTPAHELGHHLRVHRGLFTEDAWWEEQIANRVARALVGASLGGSERSRFLALVRAVVDRLGEQRGGWRVILDTYDDVLPPVGALDRPGEGRWIALDDPRAPPERLALRRALVARFNREYGCDEHAYLHQQLGWIYLALVDPRPLSLEALGRTHFGVSP